MRVFASTTFLGSAGSDLTDALATLATLQIDGIELGSTHPWREDPHPIISACWRGPLLVHNYFPPARSPFVMNLAARNADNRRRTIDHAKHSLAFAARVGAELYTVHPGFLAEAREAPTAARQYDFAFSDDKIDRQTGFGLMLDSLTEMIKEAERLGVKLAVESEGSLTKPGVLLLERPEEFDHLFRQFPDGLSINLNLAHTRFAAKQHGFQLADFIDRFRDRIAAVELSDNDGVRDEHRPLTSSSYVFRWLDRLPDVPLILEFRDSAADDIARSAELLRNAARGVEGANAA